MRGLAELEEMGDFGLFPVGALVEWLMDVEYECQFGTSLEVHEMEIQFWESFACTEIQHPPMRENIQVALLRRLASRSSSGTIPEDTPLMHLQLDTEYDRKRKFRRIRFIPRDVMGTARSVKGFCKFGLSGAYTM
jgi:hypothetical protein